MALAAATIWEIRTTGSDSNGGGFNPNNSNFPTDLTATSATGSSPVVSSASYTFVAGDVGAYVFIKSGTNWTPGFYPIASVSGGNATLDASVGAVLLYNATSTTVHSYNTTAGCATTASPTGGTWGVDYSQQASAAFAFTDMVIDGTTNTKFTSAGFPVGKNFVGNHIRVTGGTGFTVQTVEVVGTSGTTATCDKSLGTLSSTGGTGNLGGCLLTPGFWGGIHVAGNEAHIDDGTYAITSTTNNVAGGRFTLATNTSTRVTRLIGYQTKRLDYGTKPVIQASGISSFTMVTVASSACVDNLEIDGNSRASTTGGSGGQWVNCKVHRCTTGLSSPVLASLCYVTANGTGITGGVRVVRCTVTANTTLGVGLAGSTTAVGIYDSIVAANTGASTDGISANKGRPHEIVGCTITGNGRHGINQNYSYYGSHISDCIITSNGGYAMAGTSSTANVNWRNNATYNNTSGVFNSAPAVNRTPITLTGDPFTNAAGGDYSLNNTSGAGAACRAAGLLGAFPNGTTTGYRDLGAVQHQDSGGGGGGLALPVGRPI